MGDSTSLPASQVPPIPPGKNMPPNGIWRGTTGANVDNSAAGGGTGQTVTNAPVNQPANTSQQQGHVPTTGY